MSARYSVIVGTNKVVVDGNQITRIQETIAKDGPFKDELELRSFLSKGSRNGSAPDAKSRSRRNAEPALAVA